jgi:hypothetical protein
VREDRVKGYSLCAPSFQALLRGCLDPYQGFRDRALLHHLLDVVTRSSEWVMAPQDDSVC